MGSYKTTKANSIMKYSKKVDTDEGLEIVPDLSHSSDSGSEETCTAGESKYNTINRTSSSKRDHDVEPISISFSGESTIEPVTGIEYPASLNEFTYLLGCGVRTKYLFFHAYTVSFLRKVIQ
jgi:hypothetical protein